MTAKSDEVRFVYTCSSVRDLVDDACRSIDSLTEYVNPNQVIIIFTPPINEEHVQQLKSLGVEVRKRENFGRKVSTKGFNKPSYYGNKYYFTEVDAEQVIFLDCDTIIRENPSKLLQRNFKVKAKLTSRDLDSNPWRQMFEENNVSSVFEEELNAGVLVFKDNFHKEIKDSYGEFLSRDLHQEEFGGFDAHDQYALALALGDADLSVNSKEFSEMSDEEHSFSESDEPVVYHVGGNNRQDCIGKLFSTFNNRFVSHSTVQNLSRKCRAVVK